MTTSVRLHRRTCGFARQNLGIYDTTHNANIPVLGDAELVVGLSAQTGANQPDGALTAKHMGAIDARGVRELVEEVLEGGRRAFELRRLTYGC